MAPGLQPAGSLALCNVAALQFVRPLAVQPPASLLDDFGQGELHVLVKVLTKDYVVPANWNSRGDTALNKGISAELMGTCQTLAAPVVSPLSQALFHALCILLQL